MTCTGRTIDQPASVGTCDPAQASPRPSVQPFWRGRPAWRPPLERAPGRLRRRTRSVRVAAPTSARGSPAWLAARLGRRPSGPSAGALDRLRGRVGRHRRSRPALTDPRPPRRVPGRRATRSRAAEACLSARLGARRRAWTPRSWSPSRSNRLLPVRTQRRGRRRALALLRPGPHRPRCVGPARCSRPAASW